MSSPKPLCRLTEVKDTAEHVGSFLKAPDLASLCRASKDTSLLFSKHLPEMALLKAVFDANPEQVKKILELPRPPKSKCIVLTKTHIKETYFSPKLNKTGCKREWTNISPLEAAAWCGDIFLLRDLLTYVPLKQKQEAAKQLRGILKRKETAENGGFLAPYRALIKAFENYNRQFNTVYAEENWDKLEKLWDAVWQGQRLLPTYGLQEYCDGKSFDAPFSFKNPPKRSPCTLLNDPNEPLDLDDMVDCPGALIKGINCAMPAGVGKNVYQAVMRGHGVRGIIPINRLCEVRIIDLSNIIKELEGPELLEKFDFEEDKNITARP